MTDTARIAAVLLAAGRGTRFGGNKLEAPFRGGMLGEHAARAVASVGFRWMFAVHDPRRTRLAETLCRAGFALVDNHCPGNGQSHSLHLGIDAASAAGAEAMMVILGDMPFIDTALLCDLVDAHCADPATIVAASDGVDTMPPAIFPRITWRALRRIGGDVGARAMLRAARTVPADAKKLRDIDTIGDAGGCLID